MVRADYCGNGMSHTRDGTPIDVYDRLGIQQPTETSGMVFEAAWTPDGAVFVHRLRWANSLTSLQQACPEMMPSGFTQDTAAIALDDIQDRYPTALIFNHSFAQPSNHD